MTELPVNSDEVYLDHNATTQPWPEVVEAVAEAMRSQWANASSVHRFGQRVRQQVELARENVARLLNCDVAEVVFTSGGTESTNLAIHGTLERMRKLGLKRNVILTTTTEHSAVREPLELAEGSGDFQLVAIPTDREGVISSVAFAEAVEHHAGHIALISIQWANNETGVIQPMQSLANVAKSTDPRAVFHTDAIQWVGKMPTDVTDVPIDLLSFAGHKFHGPAGVGGLFVRRGIRLVSQQLGGPHERDRRGGTENVPAILGLAVAAARAAKEVERGEIQSRIAALRDMFESELLNGIPHTSVNGGNAAHGRLWNTSNIAFHRLEAEAILLGLSERKVFASAGAACSSGSLDPSPVLLAMGLPEESAHGSIRCSFSGCTTPDEVMRAIKIIKDVISRLRQLTPPVD